MDDPLTTCPDCGGGGEIADVDRGHDAFGTYEPMPCPACRGLGEVETGGAA